MTAPLLAVEGLGIALGGRRLVDGVSLAIGRGEAVGLVGESGAGKSLTAAAIAGLLDPAMRPTEGRILLDGARIDDLPERRFRPLRGRRIAMVFQDPLASLDPLHRLGQQLVETLRLHRGCGRAAARDLAVALLAELGIAAPERLLPLYPHELSGGQRQRAVIALAIAGEPDLLIADEPTSALDVAVQAQVLALFRRLRRRHGMALLLISHDLASVGLAVDRIAVMRAGRIVEEGPVAAVMARPRDPHTAALVAAIPRPRPAAPPTPGAPPLVVVERLAKEFRLPDGRLAALDDVSLAIPRGGAFGLVGESGSGKSTLARCIVGLETPTRGRIVVAGGRGRGRMQMIFQDPLASLNPRWRADDIVAEPLRQRGMGRHARRAAAAALLEQVGLPADAASRRPHAFSGGQRQRIAIARALAAEPDLLVCDEPTASLDTPVQAQIVALIRELRRRRGMTLLFISHNLALVAEVAEHVGVLQRGKLVEQGPAADVLQRPAHAYTRALLAAVPRPGQPPVDSIGDARDHEAER